jgi:phage terminase large subunit-like protein
MGETLAELKEELRELERVQKECIEQDPFYFFEPSDGTISPQGMALVKKYLKPLDIPERFAGQLDAFRSTAAIRGVSGGNQSGKSTFGAIYTYIWTTGEIPESLIHDFPMETLPENRNRNTRVVGVSSRQLRDAVLPTYKKYVPRSYLKNGKWKDSFSEEHKVLSLYKNGRPQNLIATISFMTNEQDVDCFQGPPLGLVVYDEEPKRKIHKENLMRFTTATQLNILFCWTPTKGLSWATELFMQDEDEAGRQIELIRLASVTNKCANVEVLDEALSGFAEYNEIRMRLIGEFISLSGLIYGRLFDRKKHVIQPFELNPTDYIVYRGLDPHNAKPTHCVEVAVDREGTHYVIGTYAAAKDTDDIKADLADRVKKKNYRLGYTVVDKSCDSPNMILGGVNVFLLFKRGKNAIPALRKSDKYIGSIHAGVDVIKKSLKDDPVSGKPTLYIFDNLENRGLINSFKTLERETYANEDRRGPKDMIAEGKHDAHACLRYVMQNPTRWLPPVQYVPEPEVVNEMTGY